MTKTDAQLAAAANHPSWCRLGVECQQGDFPIHVGARTAWETDPAFARSQMSLTAQRYDSIVDGHLRPGHSGIELSVIDESMDDYERPHIASAFMGPDDVRVLITFLERHLHVLENEGHTAAQHFNSSTRPGS